MGDIITAEQFDEIYDRIIWLEKLMKEVNYNHFLFNKFLCDWSYKVYYENQEYYILTDAFFSRDF